MTPTPSSYYVRMTVRVLVILATAQAAFRLYWADPDVEFLTMMMVYTALVYIEADQLSEIAELRKKEMQRRYHEWQTQIQGRGR